MSMPLLLRTTAISALLSAGGLPAGAVVMEAVYSGHVSGSTNVPLIGSVFGTDVTLDGLPYTLTFTYDTALGQLTSFPDPGGGVQLNGGAGSGLAVAEKADLTINGITYSLDGSETSVVFEGNDGTVSQFVQSVTADTSHIFDAAFEMIGTSPANPKDLTVPFAVTAADYTPVVADSYFNIGDYNYGDPASGIAPGYTLYAAGTLSVDRLEVFEAGSRPPPFTVPLPGSALLLAGSLAGIGAFRMRRHRPW